jgi:hypothetical protein
MGVHCNSVCSDTCRNCEHLARYIVSGHWLCNQMTAGGVLSKTFVGIMKDFTRHINVLPIELVLAHPAKLESCIYNTGSSSIIRYKKVQSMLTEKAFDDYNVLVLGPAGKIIKNYSRNYRYQ